MTGPPERGAGRDLALVLLAGLVVIGAGLGFRHPWPADEPVFALIARDMLASGNWLIPMAGGDFFQDKPPLLFWLQAAFTWLTGSQKAGFLLPSLLAGLGTVALVHDLGRRLWSRQAGLWAALMLLFTVQFVLQSRRAQQDALLMFFTTLSLYCLLRQLLLGGGWRWAIGAGVAAGFGVLAKVVGFLSFLVFVPWLFAWWRGWSGMQRKWSFLAWPGAVLACALVVGGWLLPLWLQARHDPAIAQYFHELVVTQTVGRYVDPWHHYQPAWYFLWVMATLWLPLSAMLPWLALAWRRALAGRDARVLLPLGFVVLYVLFFTLSSGKRDVYILPALPMLALAAGYVMPQLLQRAGVQRMFVTLTLLVAGAAGGAVIWLGWIEPARGSALLLESGVRSLAPLAALFIAAVLALARFQQSRAHLAFAATLAAGWLIAGLWVFPQMDGERSARNFIARVEQMATSDRELGLLAYHEHFLLNLSRPTVNFGHRRFREGDAETMDAAAWLSARAGRQLLVPERLLEPCFAGAVSVREVGESSRGLWYLVEGDADPACAARGDATRVFHYSPPAGQP